MSQTMILPYPVSARSFTASSGPPRPQSALPFRTDTSGTHWSERLSASSRTPRPRIPDTGMTSFARPGRNASRMSSAVSMHSMSQTSFPGTLHSSTNVGSNLRDDMLPASARTTVPRRWRGLMASMDFRLTGSDTAKAPPKDGLPAQTSCPAIFPKSMG
ncbi:hypothetical protein AUQ37_04480 [Candidatus Methanomethylophilus sp. 1R26]|uniref:hypothetical protein n=1 Tax=Candidatus Methanomethylophilus sp. 1R26 TaxID=1769296 RepID=UPI00073666BC|nr:hypothetical protein AUQ37_04480 [Candidatus Methanomethylophilus sp. 1R26]